MAALMLELLRSYTTGTLSSDERCDIEVAVKALLQRGEITPTQIRSVVLYLKGFSLSEIETTYPNAKQSIVQLLFLLEQETGYTDEHFLQKMCSKFPRYAKYKDHFRQKLLAYGTDIEGQNERTDSVERETYSGSTSTPKDTP